VTTSKGETSRLRGWKYVCFEELVRVTASKDETSIQGSEVGSTCFEELVRVTASKDETSIQDMF
jgi:hypothetical protein